MICKDCLQDISKVNDRHCLIIGCHCGNICPYVKEKILEEETSSKMS